MSDPAAVTTPRSLWLNDEYAKPERPPQAISEFVWRDKYALPGENSPRETLERVAAALAVNEDSRGIYEQLFFDAMVMGATPGGRIVANAGARGSRGKASLINCTVSETIHDSIQGIMGAAARAADTLSSGCGIGYEFSTLRYDGADVMGVGARTNGPRNFMNIYDAMCGTISSAGGRRGAQMATFDVRHPDIEAFIRAKRGKKALQKFNLSVLITDEFMAAVEADAEWSLIFPELRRGHRKRPAGLVDAHYPVPGPAREYWVDDATGHVACAVVRTVRARTLWDMIMRSTYEYSDPGFICIDRTNHENPLWWCENIRATNPCGEQPLPPLGACLLGSLDLTAFVVDGTFNRHAYQETTRVFARMLDNVVEISNLPLPGQVEELAMKRRHGMGYLGLGSALAMLGIRYGRDEAIEFTEDVTRQMAVENWQAGLALAQEKGPAPIFADNAPVDFSQSLMEKVNPGLAARCAADGTQAMGPRDLWLAARPIQRLQQYMPDGWSEAVREHGVRYSHATSIAPTGTIASFRDNASAGIEPSFAHVAVRNVIMPERRTKEDVTIYSVEMRRMLEAGKIVEGDLPEHMVEANDVPPLEHVAMQAAAQRWTDASISKTINVPSECDYEEFSGIYLAGYHQGLKGCTTYRPNLEHRTGVLVLESDLAKQTYHIELVDGTSIDLAATESVSIDGEYASLPNLATAVDEGEFKEFIHGGRRADDAPADALHIEQPIASMSLVERQAEAQATAPVTGVTDLPRPGADFQRETALESRTFKIKRPTGEGNLFVTVGLQDDDGLGLRPVEIFINSPDSSIEPWASGFAIAVTAALRANQDLRFLFEQVPQLRGADDGWRGRSLMDIANPEAKPRWIHTALSEVVRGLQIVYEELHEKRRAYVQQLLIDGDGAAALQLHAQPSTTVRDKVQQAVAEIFDGGVDGAREDAGTCPSCRSGDVVMQEGCPSCRSCGWSRCP